MNVYTAVQLELGEEAQVLSLEVRFEVGRRLFGTLSRMLESHDEESHRLGWTLGWTYQFQVIFSQMLKCTSGQQYT